MRPAHDANAVLVDEGNGSQVVQCSIGIYHALGYGYSLRIGTDLPDAPMDEAVDFQRDIAPAVELGSPDCVTGLRSAASVKENEGREWTVAVWLVHSAPDHRAVRLQGNGVAPQQQQSNEQYSQARLSRPSCGPPVQPGNRVTGFAIPSWRPAISANSARKSVVTARSRPS